MNSKQEIVCNTPIGVRRSERILRKRSFLNTLINKGDSDNIYQSNTASKTRKIEITRSNETVPENVYFNVDIKGEINPKRNIISDTSTDVRRSERLFRKRNFRNRSIINVDSDQSNQPNTTIKTKKIKIFRSNEFAKVQQPDVVVNRQQTKKLLATVEKQHNANKSTSSTEQYNNPKKMTTDENQLRITTNEACNEEAISKPEADADGERIASTETASSGDLSQQPLLAYDLGALERVIYLLTKFSNILTNTVEDSPISTEKYSENYSEESVLYEKTSLKDLMDELSKLMPSWSLSIVNDPYDPSPKYVISQMSIGMNGVPIVNKSIVLDRYFRASVYINQCLQYYYRKRYTSAAEIVKLIKTLNNNWL